MAASGMTRLRRLQSRHKTLPLADAESRLVAAPALTEARIEPRRQPASP